MTLESPSTSTEVKAQAITFDSYSFVQLDELPSTFQLSTSGDGGIDQFGRAGAELEAPGSDDESIIRWRQMQNGNEHIAFYVEFSCIGSQDGEVLLGWHDSSKDGFGIDLVNEEVFLDGSTTPINVSHTSHYSGLWVISDIHSGETTFELMSRGNHDSVTIGSTTSGSADRLVSLSDTGTTLRLRGVGYGPLFPNL